VSSRIQRARSVVLLAGLLAAAATGCSSSNSTGSGSGSATSSGTGSSGASSTTGDARAACVAAATKIVGDAREPLQVKVPPSPVDMKSLAGKQLWLISAGQTEFTQTVGAGFTEAAAAAGLTGKYVQADGQVNRMQQLVEQAVAAKAAGIALLNVTPGTVSGPLAQAKAAGIKVIDLNNGDPDAPLEDGIFAHVAATFTDDGKKKAAWALMDSGCDLHLATFTIPTITVVDLMIKAAKQQVQELCPDCVVSENEFSLSDFSTKLGPQAQTVVRRDPKIKYVDAAADAFAGIMSPVLQQSNPDVKILGHDGSPSTLQAMAAGSTLQAMTVAGPPEKYIGWTLVDQLGRALTGQQPADWSLPGRIIDKTNIGDGTEAGIHPGFTGFEKAFTDKWGM
jgi:ABC-type sugar transport system substrate-binding protein